MAITGLYRVPSIKRQIVTYDFLEGSTLRDLVSKEAISDERAGQFLVVQFQLPGRLGIRRALQTGQELEGGGGHSLSELVQDRMSHLDADAMDVLLWAVVLVPRINHKSLEQVTGLDRSRLDAALCFEVEGPG